MPHFEIKLLEGKSDTQKQKLAEAVIQAAQEVIGFGDESYSVTIEDFTWKQWKNEVYPKHIVEREDLLYKKPGYSVE